MLCFRILLWIVLFKFFVVVMVGMKDLIVKLMVLFFGVLGSEYVIIVYRKVFGIFCENCVLFFVSDVVLMGVRLVWCINFVISLRLFLLFLMISMCCCIYFNLGLGYFVY